jgi:PPK2 family polyphosphate:nucleotide phosphotransferase
MGKDTIASEYRVDSGKGFRLKHYDPSRLPKGKLRHLDRDELKEKAEELVKERLDDLTRAQELLWASDRYSVLVVLQAMDAAGKDGLIKHVMSGLNPQGCQVYSFKRPSDEELDHNFLWRCMKALPERGRIGIFNRSYYEEVLVVRVHPELLGKQKLPPGKRGRSFWESRYDDINSFEKHLSRNGTVVIKIFLNVSKEEQRKRFLERLTSPDKLWKFSAADARERAFWNEYQESYEETIRNTSTSWAPWHVVPADNKWVARAIVSEILVSTIDSLGLEYPKPTPEEIAELSRIKRRLERE